MPLFTLFYYAALIVRGKLNVWTNKCCSFVVGGCLFATLFLLGAAGEVRRGISRFVYRVATKKAWNLSAMATCRWQLHSPFFSDRNRMLPLFLSFIRLFLIRFQLLFSILLGFSLCHSACTSPCIEPEEGTNRRRNCFLCIQMKISINSMGNSWDENLCYIEQTLMLFDTVVVAVRFWYWLFAFSCQLQLPTVKHSHIQICV